MDRKLGALGLKLTRDVRDLSYTGSIRGFMARIDEADFVVLAISRNYLTSKYCLLEALQAMVGGRLMDKALPVLLDRSIFEEGMGARLVRYWEERIATLRGELEGVSETRLTSQAVELATFQMIADQIGSFVAAICDMHCTTFENLQSQHYRPLLERLGIKEQDMVVALFRALDCKNNEQRAVELERVVQEHGESKYSLLMRAQLAADEGAANKARYFYDRVVLEHPDFGSGYYNYANFLFSLGDKQGACDNFLAAIRNGHEDASVHFNLANTLSEVGDVKTAKQHYEQALRLSPDDGPAHSNFARLLLGMGQNDEARAHFEQAVRLDPEDAISLYNLAVFVGLHDKNLERARILYRKACGLNSALASPLLTKQFGEPPDRPVRASTASAPLAPENVAAFEIGAVVMSALVGGMPLPAALARIEGLGTVLGIRLPDETRFAVENARGDGGAAVMGMLQKIGAQLMVRQPASAAFFQGAVNLWLDAAQNNGREMGAIVASLGLPVSLATAGGAPSERVMAIWQHVRRGPNPQSPAAGSLARGRPMTPDEAKAFMLAWILISGLTRPRSQRTTQAEMARIYAGDLQVQALSELERAWDASARDGGSAVMALCREAGVQLGRYSTTLIPFFEAGFNLCIDAAKNGGAGISRIVRGLHLPDELTRERVDKQAWINEIHDYVAAAIQGKIPRS
jgi:tetratricopeptide (TPR) repeat protein